MRRFLLLITAAALVAPLHAAQSLGEIAKKEEARRKTVKTPAKVYTDDSLRRVDAGTPAPSPVPVPTDKTAGAVQKAAESEQKSGDSSRDESYWRKRISSERDALKRSQMFAEALQSRINALTADFVNRDDPAQQAKLGTDRQQALSELDRVKKEIVDQTKAIADTEEEARKAGVPPGWLR